MNVKFPIGPLEVPETVTLKDVAQSLAKIESYTKRLRETVDHLTEAELNKTYREGSWNVRQLVHHIADSQLNMYQRLKIALTDEQPTAPNFVQDKWAVMPDTELPVEASILMLEGLNMRINALGKTLTEDQLKSTFIHQKNGVISVGTKMIKLSWHEEHHLAHIKIALEK